MSKKLIIKLLSIFILGAFIFTLTSCAETPEQMRADKMLKKYHEKELLPMLEKYYKTIMRIPPKDIFSLSEKNTYVLSKKAMARIGPIVEDIRTFHCTYHSNEEIPRNTETWKSWMACYGSTFKGESIYNDIEDTVNLKKEKLKNNYHVTYCPYCIAIEKLKAEKTIDYLPDFTETYLLEFRNVRELLFEGLNIMTKEDELRKIIKEKLYPIINNGSMISFYEKDDTVLSYKGNSGDYYYLNLIPEYKEIIMMIDTEFHSKYHKKIDENLWNKVWMVGKKNLENLTRNDTVDVYNKYLMARIQDKSITACPFCILTDDQQRKKEGIVHDQITYQDMYVFSIILKDAVLDYINTLEQIKTAISIQKVGDAINQNEIIGIREWDNKEGAFYGTIISFSESNSYYDGYQWKESPVYNIDVIAESGRYPSSAHIRLLKSNVPYSTIADLKNGDDLYFTGKLKIDSIGSIDVINAELLDINLVRMVKENKRKASEDDLVRALANLFLGGTTPLTASDFAD